MASNFIKETIEENKVVIFSKSYCPYCMMAKEQFQKLNHEFKAIELDEIPGWQDIQAALGELTGGSTVPRVFIDGNFIGGGSDVLELYESGQLQKMLE